MNLPAVVVRDDLVGFPVCDGVMGDEGKVLLWSDLPGSFFPIISHFDRDFI